MQKQYSTKDVLTREEFSTALRERLDLLCLPQFRAARLLGVSERTLWSWLHAERDTDLTRQRGALDILRHIKLAG